MYMWPKTSRSWAEMKKRLSCDLYHRNGQKIINEVIEPAVEELWNNKITPEDAVKQIDQKSSPPQQRS